MARRRIPRRRLRALPGRRPPRWARTRRRRVPARRRVGARRSEPARRLARARRSARARRLGSRDLGGATSAAIGGDLGREFGLGGDDLDAFVLDQDRLGLDPDLGVLRPPRRRGPDRGLVRDVRARNVDGRRPRQRGRDRPEGHGDQLRSRPEDVCEQVGRAIEVTLGHGGVRRIDLRVDLGLVERQGRRGCREVEPERQQVVIRRRRGLIGREAAPRVHLAAGEQRFERTDVRQRLIGGPGHADPAAAHGVGGKRREQGRHGLDLRVGRPRPHLAASLTREDQLERDGQPIERAPRESSGVGEPAHRR